MRRPPVRRDAADAPPPKTRQRQAASTGAPVDGQRTDGISATVATDAAPSARIAGVTQPPSRTTTLPQAPGPTARAPGITLNVEALAWAAVLVAAALLRLLDLSALPLGPAEGQRARAALDLSNGLAPVEYGGDLASGLSVLALKLFGAEAWAVRLLPALGGVAAVGALALYRPLIGRGAALAAALLVAISPVAVLTARTLGPEAAALPLALVLPPLTWAVLFRGRTALLPVLALVLGFGLGTGAVFTAVLVVVVAWLAVEVAWRDAPEPGRAMRELRADPGLLGLSLVPLLAGIGLAVLRFGGGPERLSFAAVRAWAGPPRAAAFNPPWHYVPDVLLAYEPLALVLGITGLVLLVRAWRGGDGSRGDRLLITWVAVGAILALVTLHREPGQLLVLTAPLALLGGVATARLAGGLRAMPGWGGWVALAALVPVLGYALVLTARWAARANAPTNEVALLLVALVIGAIILAWIATGDRRAFNGSLLLVAWAVLGGFTLHAASNVAFGGGAEFLAGRRTVPEAEAVVSRVRAAAAPEEVIWVERNLFPQLAWPLREWRLRSFVQTPPPGVVAVEYIPLSGATAAPPESLPVGESWFPHDWNGPSMLRWWAFRRPWGDVEFDRAVVVRRPDR